MPVRTEVGASEVTNQGRAMPVCTEVGASEVTNQGRAMPTQAEVGAPGATNQAAPSELRPKRNYPNEQVSEGGKSHSIQWKTYR
jgi:hypothetical protein